MKIIVLLVICWSVAPVWRRSSLAYRSKIIGVKVKARTETLLTLEWTKMKNFSYILRYSNGTETPLTVSSNGSVLNYTVSSLSPGTKYTFVLYAMFKGVKQRAFNVTAVTRPSNVATVSVKVRRETAITFEWSKVNKSNSYIYILKKSDGSEAYIPMYWGGSTAAYTVSSLRPGTRYNYTLYTVFGGERSSGYNFTSRTMPVNVARVNITRRFADQLELSWDDVKSNNISYILRNSRKIETTIAASEEGSVTTHTVSSLAPGTRYSFTLYTVFEGIRSRGLNFSSVTASLTVTGLRCEHLPGGNTLVLVWDAPSGQWTGVEVKIKGRNPQYLNGTRMELHNLHPALWYDVTLKLYSASEKSAPVSISCQTDPGGVITGIVLVLLLLVLIICVGAHRQSVLNRKTQSEVNTKQTSTQGVEESECNNDVLTKQQNAKKCFSQRLNMKKRVEPVYQNPYGSPETPMPVTARENNYMMEQMR